MLWNRRGRHQHAPRLVVQVLLRTVEDPSPHAAQLILALHLHLDVQRLHGTEDGVVTLVADWTWKRSPDIVGHHTLVRQVRTRAAGYDALVSAHIELIGLLADVMAESLPE